MGSIPGLISGQILLFLLILLQAAGSAASALRINEVLPNNLSGPRNDQDVRSSWIEIVNNGTETVSLDDYYLTDNYGNLTQWPFTQGYQLAPGEFLLVYASGLSPADLNANFQLDPEQGSIALSRRLDGMSVELVDYLNYQGVGPDFSYGSFPDGDPENRRRFFHNTPAGPNTNAPAIVINEWARANGSEPAWFELYNPNEDPVDLSGLLLIGMDSPTAPEYAFTIPAGRTLAPKGFLRVWSDGRDWFNPRDPVELHTSFILDEAFPDCLTLSTTNGTVLDSLCFTRGWNAGRYPDGSKAIYTGFDEGTITPGQTNVAAPIIIDQPRSLTVKAGQEAVFEVQAIGPPPLSYLWLPLGGNDPVLTITNAQPNLAIRYNVVVMNNYNSAISEGAFLTVLEPATNAVISPPEVLAPLGTTNVFTVSHGGDGPFTYQWQLNGFAIPGATDPSLILTNITDRDAGTYLVQITNPGGITRSEPALLSVGRALVPAADYRTNALDITQIPTKAIAGNNTGYTTEPGERQHDGKPGGASGWYAWNPSVSGVVQFTTEGSAIDTILAVYTETNGVLHPVASDDDGGGFRNSRVRFNAMAGTLYWLAIDGFERQQGQFLLKWEFEAEGETVPVITGHPENETVTPGGTASFQVTAEGQDLEYQWYFKDQPMIGQTNSTLMIANVDLDHLGAYRVDVRFAGAHIASQSREASLEIGPAPGIRFYSKLAELLRLLPSESGGTSGGSGGIVIQGFHSVEFGERKYAAASNEDKGKATNDVDHCDAVGGNSIWYALRAEEDGWMRLDTEGSDVPTILAAYRNVARSKWPENRMGCDSTNSLMGRVSAIDFPVLADEVFLVAVDGHTNQQGDIILNWNLGQKPFCDETLTTYRVEGGSDLTIPILAGGFPPPEYHWLLNKRPFRTTSEPALNLQNIQPEHVGTYEVVVSNSVSQVRCAIATVIAPYPLPLEYHLEGDAYVVSAFSPLTFAIEASTNLLNWETILTIPRTRRTISLTNRLDLPRQFFRPGPWPPGVAVGMEPTGP